MVSYQIRRYHNVCQYLYGKALRPGPICPVPLANPPAKRRDRDVPDESPVKVPRRSGGCAAMSLRTSFRDFCFYARATARGLALVMMIGILTVRFIVTDKPFLSA